MFAIYERIQYKQRACGYKHFTYYFNKKYFFKDYNEIEKKALIDQACERLKERGIIDYGLTQLGNRFTVSYYLTPKANEKVGEIYEQVIQNKAESLTEPQKDLLLRVRSGLAQDGAPLFLDDLGEYEMDEIIPAFDELYKKGLAIFRNYHIANFNEKINRANIAPTTEGSNVARYIESHELTRKNDDYSF